MGVVAAEVYSLFVEGFASLLLEGLSVEQVNFIVPSFPYIATHDKKLALIDWAENRYVSTDQSPLKLKQLPL